MKRLELVRDVCGILGLLVVVGWIVGNGKGVGQALFAVGSGMALVGAMAIDDGRGLGEAVVTRALLHAGDQMQLRRRKSQANPAARGAQDQRFLLAQPASIKLVFVEPGTAAPRERVARFASPRP